MFNVLDKVDSTSQVTKNQQQTTENVTVEAGAKRTDLPTYTAEEVSKHDKK